MPFFKRLKRLIGTAAIIAISVGLGATIHKTPPADVAADDIHASVFLIELTTTARVRQIGYSTWSPPISLYGSCTAFFVDDTGHALTAKHCIDPEVRKQNILSLYLGSDVAEMGEMTKSIMAAYEVSGLQTLDLKIVSSQPYGPMIGGAYPLKGRHSAVVVDDAPDDNSDQALLQVEGLEGPVPYLRIAADSLSAGDRIYAVGYPGVTNSGAPPFVFSPGNVLSAAALPMLGETMVSAPMWFGMSGGPTVNAKGEIVGINKRLFSQNPNFTFVTDRNDIATFLKEKDISQPPTTSPIYKRPWFIIPAAGILLLVVLSPLLLLFVGTRTQASITPQPVG